MDPRILALKSVILSFLTVGPVTVTFRVHKIWPLNLMGGYQKQWFFSVSQCLLMVKTRIPTRGFTAKSSIFHKIKINPGIAESPEGETGVRT